MLRITGGDCRGRQLKTVPGLSTRPTSGKVRQALFNIVQFQLADSSWLDLFAGSGVVGIEALSRGAANCLFVEKEPRCCGVITANLDRMALPGGLLWCMDFKRATEKLLLSGQQFDFVFADPPYGAKDAYTTVLKKAAGLLRPEGMLILEHLASETFDSELELVKSRSYGDSALSFFIKEGLA